MSAADILTIGNKLPRIAAVSFLGGHAVAVTWAPPVDSAARNVVDLAPLIFRLKFYAPLRSDPDLMSSVHIVNSGSAIAWGSDHQIDMAATSVLRLAEEAENGTAVLAAK